MPFLCEPFLFLQEFSLKQAPGFIYLFFWWGRVYLFIYLFDDLLHSAPVLYLVSQSSYLGCPGDAMVKNPPATVGDSRDLSSIPGLGRSLAEGHGTPLQYSCLENPMDREAWRLRSMGLQRVRHDWAWTHGLLIQCIIFWVQDNFFFLFLLFSLTTLPHKISLETTF